MASKMSTKGHVTIFVIIGSNESLIYQQYSVKIHSNRLNGSGDSVLIPYTLNIQESLEYAYVWH